MKILIAQLNMCVGDFKGNCSKIVGAIEKGKRDGCDLVVFPELAICGYPPQDLLLHHTFIEEMEVAAEALAAHTEGIAVVVGLARKNPQGGEKGLLNSALVLENGAVKGFYDKWLIPSYDVFNERRYFDAGEERLVIEVAGNRVGITICEDIWGGQARYKTDPVEALKKEGLDLLVNISASPYYSARPQTRVDVCSQVAKSVGCPVILCAQVGANDQLVFDGYSLVVDAKGELRQHARGFAEEMMLVDLDALPPPTKLLYDPMLNLYSALVLGVRDYFAKHDFRKGLVGLSGGVDSSLTACIAVDALGKENVLGVTMPSRYSSEGSVKDAEALARNLGIECLTIPIEEPFSSFLNLLGPYFKEKKEDVTEENMQARIRGMILMAISNKFGHVVLSTGNKSEVAVGYATLYGDMCGGLGVLSDVSKTRVYALSRYLNREREIIPVSAIEKPPSAELRADQKDSDSLPDYAIVDAILEGYVEEHLSAQEICEKDDLPREVVDDLIERIHLAEYKRRQGPPGIRVTKRAFSVGRHYPIVHRWR